MVWTGPRVHNPTAGFSCRTTKMVRNLRRSDGYNDTDPTALKGTRGTDPITWKPIWRPLWSLLWWSFAKPAEHLPGRIAQGQPYFRQFAIPSLQCNRQTRNLRVIALNPVFPPTLEPATLSSALRWIRASSLMFSQQARERSVETAGLLLWFCKSSEIT